MARPCAPLRVSFVPAAYREAVPLDDLLREFLTETNESMETLSAELVKLERNPDDPALLGNIFRLMHTIKGTCGFLGLPRLESVAHAGENVLGKVREGALKVTPEAVSLVLAALDCVKTLLVALETTEAEPPGDDKVLISRLNACAEGRSSAAPAAPAEVAAPAPPEAEAAADESPTAVTQPDRVAGVAPKQAASDAGGGDHGAQKESAVAAQSIRVSVGVLENLITMVSELVLTRNQLMQLQRGRVSVEEFAAPLQQLNHITSELQDGVMKTRMQPIGNAWSKLPRLVRDLSHELGRKIELDMRGAETELDRQVLELIRDPLTHMVRNSADHGIEGAAERIKAGKPPVGTISLDAFHEGGHIIIEVKDDGKGLDAERIRKKIVSTGLASEAEVAEKSDQQVFQYIFRAGFSTATTVTKVSGRGVGMDVVRTNIEKIGGTVELKSATGKGTAFIIKIPLTLAIVSALVIECGGERFAVPQINVLELVRARKGAESRIERVNDAAVLRLRDRLLPLVPLRKLLRLEEATTPSADIEQYIVVIQVGARKFGIIVDRVFDTEEIVVKPVQPLLREIQLFAGNTILGDGSVIMILDPNGIASAASTDLSIADRSNDADARAAVASSAEDRVAMLVFKAGGDTPKAVPLALVARIEEIEVGKIESSASGQPVVQYRRKLMPLVLTDGGTLKESGRQPLLVFADGDRSMGVVVDEVVDIVETRLEVEMRADRPGTLGSAIINGKATDVIDTSHFLTQAHQDWFHRPRVVGGKDAARQRVLVVEDSAFFREMLTPLLATAGYDVTGAASAEDALELCESGRDFDVIVSEIDMPGMSGFDFAATLRAGGRWQKVPIVALTAQTGPETRERGRQAGFAAHVRKFDRDALLQSLSSTLASLKGAA